MNTPPSTGSRIAKGCAAGCVALIALAMLLGVVLWILARNADHGPPRHEDHHSEHALPTGFDPTSEANEGAVSEDGQQDSSTAFNGDLERQLTATAGRLELDLSMGQFEVIPIATGLPLRIESRYDANQFQLSETFRTDDSGAWSQHIKFGPKGKIMFGNVDADSNVVKIYVPSGHPFALDAEIDIGESVVDLSGLDVTTIDLEFAMGDHQLRFTQPSPRPLEYLRIESKMGEIAVDGLGWASPALVTLDHSMGELRISADGTWQQDARFEIESTMGSVRLLVPADLDLQMGSTAVKIGSRTSEDRPLPPEHAKVLTVRSKVTMGELDVRTIEAAGND